MLTFTFLFPTLYELHVKQDIYLSNLLLIAAVLPNKYLFNEWFYMVKTMNPVHFSKWTWYNNFVLMMTQREEINLRYA